MRDSDKEPLAGPGPQSLQDKQFVFGFALLSKKAQRYLTPTVKVLAAEKGIQLCLIDISRSLESQGPFNAIIHKLSPDADWEAMLRQYCTDHPETKVIDEPNGIHTIQNRSTMLSALWNNGLLLRPQGPCSKADWVRVQAPPQVEILEDVSVVDSLARLEASGLQAPFLVKPLWTDGREGSHGLAVVLDMEAMGRLLSGEVVSDVKPPVVVQQFVEHGGVLYKVYVLGPRTVISTRPSLGDNYLGRSALHTQGVLTLPRISCKSCNALESLDSDSDGPSPKESTITPPPDWAMHSIASTLRERLGLQLFNFDLICPEGGAGRSGSGEAVGVNGSSCSGNSSSEGLYYVIDINYFPGVDKIPHFEHLFVDFLYAVCMGEEDALQEPFGQLVTEQELLQSSC